MIRRLLTSVAALGIVAGVAPITSQVAFASSSRPNGTAAPLTALRAARAMTAPTVLGTSSFGRILVDPATSHVFVSSPGTSSIVVLDFTGTIVKTITGEAGAYGMALSGSTLYVALSTTGSIDRIDTGTLTETSVLVSGLLNPRALILAASKLWTTTGNCANWTVQLASVDPAATPPAVVTYASAFTGNNGLSYCADFASNPTSNPGTLLAWDPGLSPADITSFDVSSGTPVQQLSVHEGVLGNLRDVAVTPDGTKFLTASGSPYEFDEWTVATLTQDGVVYPANTYPSAIATTAANGSLMAGGLDGIYDFDFYAYQIGRPSAPMTKVDFGGTSNTVPARGVAFSPDGTKAFVITMGSSGSAPVLNVVPIPAAGSPAPPTAVTASPGYGSATVSWTPPTDPGSSPVTSYTVTSSPGGITVTTSGTSTSVSGLTAGVAYTFTVTATNTTGPSAPSAPSNSVTAWSCGPPTSVSATPGDRAALVQWLAPTNTGNSPITSYLVTPYIGSAAQPGTTVSGAPPATYAVINNLSDGTTYTFVVSASNSGGRGQDSAPSNAVTPIQGGNYHPLAPARIFDSRNAIGGPTRPMANGETRGVQIIGQGGVPATAVSAVVLNVTVTNPTAGGYVTVYPSGVTRPTASNLNFVPGQTVPNLVEVAVGGNGQVSLFTQLNTASGTADVIFDVAGWVGVASNSMVKDGLYNPVTPARIMDTRSGIGIRQGTVGQGQTVTLNLLGSASGSIPATGVSAVVLNVTVTGPTAPSFLTVFPGGTQPPTASNLNFLAGQTVPNRVIVKLGSGGTVSFFNAGGNVHVIADVGGWFTDGTSTAGGSRFSGVVPQRMLDTRNVGIGPLYGGAKNTFQLLNPNNQPVTGVTAVVFNVTVTNPTSSSFLTLWPDGVALPTVSDLNFTAGQTVANLVVVKLGANSTIDIYNALGQTDVVMDLVGYYGYTVPAPAMAPHFGRLSKP